MMNYLKFSELYSAIFKSVFGRISVYIIQFISLAVFARIFTPEEFGIVASIQVFVIFFQMLSDIGIGPALINQRIVTNTQRDGIFSVTLFLGVTVAVCFFLFSFLLNDFYDGYDYTYVGAIVSCSIVFNSLLIVPITSINKDAKFLHLAAIDIFVELFVVLLVYLLYDSGFGVLALASRSLITSIIKFILVYYVSSSTSFGRARFGREIEHIKPLIAFSFYQTAFNLVNYFSRNLDNIIIAKVYGMGSLGVYQKAYQLMRYPLMVTTFAMTPAIQPILTKRRDDVSYVVKEHNKLSARLFFISLFISCFLFHNAKELVDLILGNQWSYVSEIVKIFSFFIPIQAVMSTSGSFFQSMNKPKHLFFSGLLSAIMNVLAIITAVYLGDIKTVAYSLVISFSINFVQCYFILFKYVFKLSSREFVWGLIRSFSTATIPLLIYTALHLFIKTTGIEGFNILMLNFILSGLIVLLFGKVIFNYLKNGTGFKEYES